MTDHIVLTPQRLPVTMLVEIAGRIGLAGFLAYVGSTDPDQGIVLMFCAFAALYHLYVALRIASFRMAGPTALTLDATGLTLRRLWRDRHIAWSAIVRVDLQQARLFSGQRAGVVLTLGDRKGPIEMVPIPDVFAPGPNQLMAELKTRLAHI